MIDYVPIQVSAKFENDQFHRMQSSAIQNSKFQFVVTQKVIGRF